MTRQRWSENIWILPLTEDPEFSEEVEELQAELLEHNKLPSIVLDLSELHSINSSNLSLLLRLRKQLIDGDSTLRIVSPPDAVWVVFMSTALDKVFTFKANLMEALTELQMQNEK
ncbi:STAS domain-containing protein [Planctomycetota bacterium]|nr:STAS domain-containing protein [Planctomycetota bacterium]